MAVPDGELEAVGRDAGAVIELAVAGSRARSVDVCKIAQRGSLLDAQTLKRAWKTGQQAAAGDESPKEKVNVAPLPTDASPLISPPCRSTILRTVASPMPLPSNSLGM